MPPLFFLYNILLENVTNLATGWGWGHKGRGKVMAQVLQTFTVQDLADFL